MGNGKGMEGGKSVIFYYTVIRNENPNQGCAYETFSIHFFGSHHALHDIKKEEREDAKRQKVFICNSYLNYDLLNKIPILCYEMQYMNIIIKIIVSMKAVSIFVWLALCKFFCNSLISN